MVSGVSMGVSRTETTGHASPDDRLCPLPLAGRGTASQVGTSEER